MADDRGQAGLIFCNGQNARVNPHLAPGQTKGVGFFALEHHKLPLRVGQVRSGHGGDALAHTLHERVDGRVAVDGHFLLGLLEGVQAKLQLLAGGKHVQLCPSRDRNRGATAAHRQQHRQREAGHPLS
jgi:hypothetical protein